MTTYACRHNFGRLTFSSKIYDHVTQALGIRNFDPVRTVKMDQKCELSHVIINSSNWRLLVLMRGSLIEDNCKIMVPGVTNSPLVEEQSSSNSFGSSFSSPNGLYFSFIFLHSF